MSVRKGVVYLNGEYVPTDQAAVSVLDHGFLYGDGVFESLVVVGGRVFRLDDHLERLYRSAATVKLALPLAREELRQAVLETVRRNGSHDGYLRVIVSRGPGYPVLDPRAAEAPTIVVLPHGPEWPAAVRGSYRPEGMRLHIASVRKTPSICVEAQVKSLNYLNQILARMEAVEAGADEAILLDIHDFVAEGPGENVFAVHSGRLVTPPVQNILAGITRATLIELASELGHEAVERPMTPYDLYTADEVFLTSTFGGVLPVAEIGGRRIGGEQPGPLTRALRERYDRFVRETGVPAFEATAAER